MNGGDTKMKTKNLNMNMDWVGGKVNNSFLWVFKILI